MKHIQTLVKPCIKNGKNTGCGECASSCQSACKTSCTVGNQNCEKETIRVHIVKKEQL